MRRNVKNTKCCDENLIEHIKNTIPEIRITEKVVDDGHDVGGGGGTGTPWWATTQTSHVGNMQLLDARDFDKHTQRGCLKELIEL